MVYLLPCCGTLLLSGLGCEQDERADKAIKANIAMKMLRFLLGVELKTDNSLAQLSPAAGTSYWSGGRWKYHLSIK